MTKEKREIKRRGPWGRSRIPLFKDIRTISRAYGYRKFNEEVVWAIIADQAKRPKEDFPWGTRQLRTAYINATKLKAPAKVAFNTQLLRWWRARFEDRKIYSRRARENLERLNKGRRAKGLEEIPVPPPPPPNAVQVNSEVNQQITLAHDLEAGWEGFARQSPWKPIAPPKGNLKYVCVQAQFKDPDDQEEIVSHLVQKFEELKWNAKLMKHQHTRTLSGLWVDLLIEYEMPVVELYKCVLNCPKVLNAKAKAAARFGVPHGKGVS